MGMVAMEGRQPAGGGFRGKRGGSEGGWFSQSKYKFKSEGQEESKGGRFGHQGEKGGVGPYPASSCRGQPARPCAALHAAIHPYPPPCRPSLPSTPSLCPTCQRVHPRLLIQLVSFTADCVLVVAVLRLDYVNLGLQALHVQRGLDLQAGAER